MGRLGLGGLALTVALAGCGGGQVALPPPPTADVILTTTLPPTTTTTTTSPPTTAATTAPTAGVASQLTTTTVATTTTTTVPTQTYVVVSGDTLVTIAERFGSTAEQLARLNRLADPRRLQVGQTLAIPLAPDGAAGASG